MRIKTVAELEAKAKELVECLNADCVLAGTPLAKVMAEKEIPSTRVFLKVPRAGYDPDFDAPLPDDTDEAWQEAKDDDLIYVCQGVLRTVSEESAVGSDLSLRMVLATKRAHDNYLSRFSYALVDERPDDCLFVFNINFTWFKDHLKCWIADRGVALPYRQKGCVTRASVQALRPMYEMFGDCEVESIAVHIGTALFFATTEQMRAGVRALDLEPDGTLADDVSFVGKKPLLELLRFHEKRQGIRLVSEIRRQVAVSMFALGLFAGVVRKDGARVTASAARTTGAGGGAGATARVVDPDALRGPVPGQLLLTNG